MGNKILVALGALAVILSMSVFTVGETERVIKFQLGEIVGADFQPGMHLKIPFINNVKKFDARILTMDATPERFLTAEKKNVIVDSFVKWRIGDVKTFYTTVGGDVGRPISAWTRLSRTRRVANSVNAKSGNWFRLTVARSAIR